MTRIGVAYEADPLTSVFSLAASRSVTDGRDPSQKKTRRFLSLAGVGDLFLTCSSEKSRNFTVGFRLGKGERLAHILDTIGSVAEGVDTAKSAFAMVQERGISAPMFVPVFVDCLSRYPN